MTRSNLRWLLTGGVVCCGLAFGLLSEGAASAQVSGYSSYASTPTEHAVSTSFTGTETWSAFHESLAHPGYLIADDGSLPWLETDDPAGEIRAFSQGGGVSSGIMETQTIPVEIIGPALSGGPVSKTITIKVSIDVDGYVKDSSGSVSYEGNLCTSSWGDITGDGVTDSFTYAYAEPAEGEAEASSGTFNYVQTITMANQIIGGVTKSVGTLYVYARFIENAEVASDSGGASAEGMANIGSIVSVS